MRITCPNCHAPLHIVDGSPAASVTCESCGSRIVLRDDPDETLTLPPLVKGQLEHFELLSELGHGGFGTVWKAHDTRLNRLVAIKVPRGDATTKIDRDRFRREAQALAGLDDPRIVPVYATSHSPPYIVTKFIEGQTLSAAIRAGLEFRRAAEICAEVAEAIEHAHAAGVLHRDLKPRNIMVTPQGAPVVLDFGLARLDGGGEFALTREGEVLGTPEWIAPECLVNNRPDARSDVWSLGVILYEALTRKRPFKAEPGATDHHTLYYQIVHSDPPRPTALAPNLPRDLETICLHALEKNPDARYQSAKECAEDLREWLAGRPLKHARRPSAWTRLKTSLRGQATLIGMSSLSLATLVLAAFVLLQFFRRQPEPPTTLVTVPVAPVVRMPSGELAPRGESHERSYHAERAQLTCWLLDPKTNAPQFGAEVRAAGPSPLQVRLRPGRYLVVAVVEGHGFHEVYRTVPDDDRALPGAYRHNSWTPPVARKAVGGGQPRVNSVSPAPRETNRRVPFGEIVWPAIDVPPHEVTRDMVGCEPGRKAMTVQIGDADDASRWHRRIPNYYLDAREYTIGDRRRQAPAWSPPTAGPTAEWLAGRPDDFPLVGVSYEEAVDLAEEIGKRLPDEFEHEWAARFAAQRRLPPAGDDAAAQPPPELVRVVPVSSIQFDRYDTDPPLVGLRSNVAEWTDSIPTYAAATSVAPVGADFGPLINLLGETLSESLRTVRGGDDRVIHDSPRTDATPAAESPRVPLIAFAREPGLGFRCARSAQPRLKSTDFGRWSTAP